MVSFRNLFDFLLDGLHDEADDLLLPFILAEYGVSPLSDGPYFLYTVIKMNVAQMDLDDLYTIAPLHFTSWHQLV
ncbi:hypothetical protein ACQKML_03110 [Peribacillus frigoritolerans]